MLQMCPQCNKTQGKIQPQSGDPDLVEALPAGLDGVTLVQCQNCFHEWQIVTHAQILRSMASWPGNLSRFP